MEQSAQINMKNYEKEKHPEYINMYAVRDDEMGYMQPFVCPNHAMAIRMFAEEVNKQDSQMNKYKSHFSLCYIGKYDKNSGKIEATGPQEVIKATQCENTDKIR